MSGLTRYERGLTIPAGALHGRARPGSTPTLRELQCLEAYARLANRQAVADELGISVHSVRNLLEAIYIRLGVISGIEAFTALGWLTPERPEVSRARLLGYQEVAA